MSCLTRFESKSPRVKGIVFHPKRPWVLVSLHNGIIQLWDYRMCTLIDKFDEHQGPVRGIDFHSNQPIFVSGGDDYKIKVWNYKTKRCLFTLLGHLDYIRTTFFHKEYPWIISASDDQTIRIWNWQSRTAISVLTGHTHYVMCAQFHPKEDLVVSASLDQNIRVWDISGLRKKSIVPSHTGLEEQIKSMTNSMSMSTGSTELFGSADVVVKHVLEGHDRGVNWVAFHPTSKLIVSAADDRQVKIWRMNDMRAWELDTCRGHYNNVSCALFHPRGDLILSNSEDKSIRIWDMAKRTCITSIRRENDRFWVLAAHPHQNLFAAGHDNGFVVFKLERERPAMAVYRDSLYYVKDDTLRKLDFNTERDVSLLQIRKTQGRTKPYSLAYNHVEDAVLIVTRGLTTDNASYDLYNIPKNTSGSSETPQSDGKRGAGLNAVWVARNKFAVLENSGVISIKNMANQSSKTLEMKNVEAMFYAGTGSVVLKESNSISIYDVVNKKVVASMKNVKVRQIVWSADSEYVAVISKLFLYLCDRNLDIKTNVHENVSIKSGCWDESGVFVYTTSTHIKYALLNGDHGIIRTLDLPIYLTRVSGAKAYCLDRQGTPSILTIDPTEYRFKLALIGGNNGEVLRMVKNAKLVGQSMIAYLQKKGYPEIALHFVKDERTRFALALECGNLDVALEVARSLNDNQCWERLGELALMYGNHQIVEMAYQRTKNYDKLNFLYLITGNLEKLRKMMKISETRKDFSKQFQTALFLGDVEERIKILNNVGQKSLAYLTAVTHGIADTESVASIKARLETEGITVPQPENKATLLMPPVPVTTTAGGAGDSHNWPLLTMSKDVFEIAMGAAVVRGSQEAAPGLSAVVKDLSGAAGAAWGDDDDLDFDGEGDHFHDARADDDADAEAGWGIDDSIYVSPEMAVEPAAGLRAQAGSGGGYVPPCPGRDPRLTWAENSSLVIDQVLSGAFSQAMLLLHEQIAVVDFTHYKTIFLQLSARARTSFAGLPCGPNLFGYPQKKAEEATGGRHSLPATSLRLTDLHNRLQAAYDFTTKGKFTDAVDAFRYILLCVPLLSVDSKAEEQEARALTRVCTQYIVGLSMESARKALDPAQHRVRIAEMACYFTHCQLEPVHLVLTLRNASNLLFKLNNFGMAAQMTTRLLNLDPLADIAEKARRMLTVCQQKQTNEVQLAYNPRNPFSICAASYTPIYQGSEMVKDTLSEACYLPMYRGQLCRVTKATEIGGACAGLKIRL